MCRAQDVSASADRLLEREANVFAAELLMPEPQVRDHAAGMASVGSIAKRFDVSEVAMNWRLYSFGLSERPA
jgi:Zn-dependent peptidase ImmA (M78 family)